MAELSLKESIETPPAPDDQRIRGYIDRQCDEILKAMGEIFAGHRATVSTTIDRLNQRVTKLEGQVEDLKRAAARPGKLPPIREYVVGRAPAMEIVTHAGALWQARCDTMYPPPHGDWICLVRAGRDGQSPEVRGTFDSGENYKRLDVVAKNGAAFIARRDDPGDCPGSGWQMISRQGTIRRRDTNERN
jgi:hypothetical protein